MVVSHGIAKKGRTLNLFAGWICFLISFSGQRNFHRGMRGRKTLNQRIFKLLWHFHAYLIARLQVGKRSCTCADIFDARIFSGTCMRISYQTCGGGNEAGLANSAQATILVWHGMASLWGEWNMTLRLKRVLISALGCFQAGRRLTLRSRPGWSGSDEGCPNAKMGVVAMSIWIHSLRAIFLGFQNRISGPRKNHIYPSKGSEQLQIRIDGEERDIFCCPIPTCICLRGE